MDSEDKKVSGHNAQHNHSKMESTERKRQFFRSFEAKSLRSRSLLTQIADDLTAICGSTAFLFLHIFFFAFWILVNTGRVPNIKPFDPYPFGFLTMVVSLEAIFLALFILVSQNRSSFINTIRDEVHLRVNLIAEEEITKVLHLLAEIRKEMGVKKLDPELEEMLQRLDTNHIERSIIEQIERSNKPLMEQLVKEFPELLEYSVKKPIEMVQNMANNDESEKESKSTKTA